MELRDLRETDRFVPMQPMQASFGAVDAAIVDMGEDGVQIEHAQPLRIATTGRFVMRRADVSIGVNAVVVWSRLSKTPNADGKLLYRSGLRVEESNSIDLRNAIDALVLRHLLRHDSESLERKKQALAEREREIKSRPIVKVIRQDVVDAIPPDQVLLIQHARERLRANPDEALKWYNRAKFALINEKEMIRHREDVLAVWEYLERSIDIATIIRVFERGR